MSYVVAAYGVTAASLLAYAIALLRERAKLARHEPVPSKTPS